MTKLSLLWLCLMGSTSIFAAEVRPQQLDPTGFVNVLARSGDVFIAGQPDRSGLERVKAEGVTRVINIRTMAEMTGPRAPMDEAAIAAELGLEYVQIPLGGEDAPYTPDAVAQFAAALDSAGGKVLLHCGSARRASFLWAAYLVRYRGLPVTDAVEQARAINFGSLPLEDLLGEKLEISETRLQPSEAR